LQRGVRGIRLLLELVHRGKVALVSASSCAWSSATDFCNSLSLPSRCPRLNPSAENGSFSVEISTPQTELSPLREGRAWISVASWKSVSRERVFDASSHVSGELV